MSSLVRDGIALLAAEGPGTALRKGATVCANEAALLARYWGRIARHRLRRDAAAPHPWAPVAVDPYDVAYTNKAEPVHGGENVTAFDSIDDAGRIVGGDWDRRVRVRFEEMPKARGVRRRFEDGVPWEETDLWTNLASAIEEGGSIDGCHTRRDLRRRYRDVDALYESIASEGFLPRSAFVPRYDVDGRLDLPKVNVARDGTLIKAAGSGYHRIAIARVLEIPVPVRVLVRHAEWQSVREAYARADSPDDLDPRLRAFAGHPDLADVTPAPDRARPDPVGPPARERSVDLRPH